MSVLEVLPNKIELRGVFTYDKATPTSVAATPGQIVELFDTGTTVQWRFPADAVTMVEMAIVLEDFENDLGIGDLYTIGDLMNIGYPSIGGRAWMLVKSGQTVDRAALFVPEATSGLLIAAGAGDTSAAGRAKFRSRDDLGVLAANTNVTMTIIGG